MKKPMATRKMPSKRDFVTGMNPDIPTAKTSVQPEPVPYGKGITDHSAWLYDMDQFEKKHKKVTSR